MLPACLYWPAHAILPPAVPETGQSMSEFSWWLLIVGLVIGGGLVWLVLADAGRRDDEISERELRSEAAWIAAAMADSGHPIDPSAVEEVLYLHRSYLASLPPDDPGAADAQDAGAGEADASEAPGPSPATDLPDAPTDTAHHFQEDGDRERDAARR
jgi:hypothetical protein